MIDQENYSRIHSDSGIKGRSYKQIYEELRELESRYPDLAAVVTYGKSVRGEDLHLLRIRKIGNFQRRPGVLIAGTIHGNEFLNIEDRLPRWLLENQIDPGVSKFLNSGGVVWIAPIMNPDGYAARQRANRNGKDLNRDFGLKSINKAGFTQPETASLISTIRTELQSQNASLNLTFDYHCCFGGVLYPWGYSKTNRLPEKAKAEHLRVGAIIINQFPSYKIGGTYELLGYAAVGNSKDFYHETFGATAFTFEGVRYREKDKFAQHTKMWSDLLKDQAMRTGAQQIPAPDGNEPKVAILKSSETGLWLAVSGSRQTNSVAICTGDVPGCSPSQTIIGFTFSYSRGDRSIFHASSELPLVSGDTFTVQTYDSNAIPLARAVIKFKKR